jgi:raffinose/stachyose/melibiose transport system substrate-binding protein
MKVLGTRRRRAALATVAAVAAVTAAAAQVSSAAPKTAHETVTLHMLVGVQETAALEQKSKQDIANFERLNPGIKIEREAINNDQLRTLIQTRLRSNSGPDIFGYDTGPGYGGVLAKARLIKPLDEAYAKNHWKIFPWAKARATYGGHVYAIPDQVEALGVFYNVDLFNKLHLQVPKTVQQLEKINDTLKSKGYIPMSFADKDQWPAYHQFSMVTSNLLGRKGLENIIFGNGKWNSPKVVKGIDLFFHQFEDKGYFPPTPTAISYDDGNNLFLAGKAAMVPTGTWLVGELSEKAQFKVGMFPFPSIDGSQIAQPTGIGGGLFVSAKTQHWPEVQKYLNYIQTPSHAKYEIENFSTLPAFPVNTNGLKVSPLYKQVINLLVGPGAKDRQFGENVDVLTPQRFNTAMSTGFQDVLTGKKTAQQVADALQKAWQTAKAKGETLKPV